MAVAALVVAAVAGLIHAWIFVLESLWFERPSVWVKFGLQSAEEARVVRGFAFNQGFYNLFLAIGVAAGIGLILAGGNGALGDPGLVAAGRAVAIFACASMAAAGMVLISTDRRFLRAAALQIVPGLSAVLLLLLAA
jgi:putative membrane protein